MHLKAPIAASPKRIPDPEPPNPREIRPSLDAEYGIPQLRKALAQFGDPPAPPQARRPDPQEIARSKYRELIRDIPAWKRSQRKAAWARAAASAEAAADFIYQEQREYCSQVAAWIAARQEELAEREEAIRQQAGEWVRQEQEKRQQRVDAERIQAEEEWSLLERNDPAVTTYCVKNALKDAEVPAAVQSVEGNRMTLAVVCQAEDDWVAERERATTAAGRPTTKKRSKTQRNELYLAAIASAVLAAAQVALAAAPGIVSVTCIAARRDSTAGESSDRYVPIYIGSFTGELLAEFHALGVWTDDPVDLQDMLRAADEVRLIEKGRAKDVQPLDGQ